MRCTRSVRAATAFGSNRPVAVFEFRERICRIGGESVCATNAVRTTSALRFGDCAPWPISDYGVLARLSDHRGRVRIVPQEIVRDRVLLASGSVTIRASVRATVVHADVDAFDTAAGFSLVPVFGGGDAVAGDPLDQVFVDTRPPGMPGLAQIDLDCACFQPDRAVRDRASERGGHRFDLAAFRRTDVLPVQGRTDMAVAVDEAEHAAFGVVAQLAARRTKLRGGSACRRFR